MNYLDQEEPYQINPYTVSEDYLKAMAKWQRLGKQIIEEAV